MSLRLYWSPIVLSQIDEEPPPGSWRGTIRQKTGVRAISMIIPSEGIYNALGDVERSHAGNPRHSHALCRVQSDDAGFWSQVEADPNEVLLASFADGQTMFRRMKSATVGDVPAELRANWNLVLTQMGAQTADIDSTTPMIRVLRRLVNHINPRIEAWDEED